MSRSLDPEMADDAPTDLQLEYPALAACYDAAAQGVSVTGERAGHPTLRLMPGDAARSSAAAGDDRDEPVAEVRGINL